MTTNGEPERKLNRWVIPGVVAATLCLPCMLIAVAQILGLPFRLFPISGPSGAEYVRGYAMLMALVGAVSEVVGVVALMAGTAALVETSLRRETDAGRGWAVAILLVTLVTIFLPRFVYMGIAVATGFVG